VTIKMYNHCLLSSKKLSRISFNTAFLDSAQKEVIFLLLFSKRQLPSQIKEILRNERIH